ELAPERPDPVTVTAVPPPTGPLVGLTPVTCGPDGGGGIVEPVQPAVCLSRGRSTSAASTLITRYRYSRYGKVMLTRTLPPLSTSAKPDRSEPLVMPQPFKLVPEPMSLFASGIRVCRLWRPPRAPVAEVD